VFDVGEIEIRARDLLWLVVWQRRICANRASRTCGR
jgi:hypothetical protein